MWFLLACTTTGDVDTATSPGPGGSAASYCAELSREPVTDADTAAAGFDFAASDVVYDNVGDWYGTFEYATTGSTSARTTLRYDGGEIFAVEQELVDPSGTDTGPATGAPDPYCPSYYEVALGLDVHVGDGELAEDDLTISMVAVTRASPTFLVTIALDQLSGTAAPSWDPRDWATNTLYADAYRADEAWILTVGWWGSSESTSRRAAPKEEVDTGAVDVSGTSESFGRAELWLDVGG